LVADVPLGASLSGGIDSASIVHFMSKLNNSPVKTFTVGFNDISDELNEAKKIAEFYNTEHHEIIVDFKDITKNIPKILWNAEIPFAKPAMYATYFLSKGIRERNVTIDLSGEGSDEIFGGYNRYDIYLNNQLSNFYKSKQVVSSYFPENEDKNNFFQDTVLEIDESSRPESIIKSDLDKTYKEEHLNTALNFEIKKQLPGVHLLRVDKMSMAHSHEIRVPFLDYNLVEFAMTIPSNQKWNNGDKKWVLQKAMKGLLPEEVIKRKKMPFHMPLLKYFQEEFIDVAEPILSNSSLINKIANKDYILNQIKRIKNREETEDNKLRQILFLTNLDLFNKIFIEGIKKEKLEINNFL
jgi:asparagine synthase (glutamine-hydrolysing)